MKGIPILLLFLFLVFNIPSFGQDKSISEETPYRIKERIILENNVKNIDLWEYYLCDYGDSIIVLTKEKTKKDIFFHFKVYAKNGAKGSILTVALKKAERDYLKERWEVNSITVHNDQIYLLLSYQIWAISFPKEKEDVYFRIIHLDDSFDIISSVNNHLFIQRVAHSNRRPQRHINKVALVNIKHPENEFQKNIIDAYTPKSYFLMFFEPRNYYGIDPSGRFIIKLYNDKPEFDILNLDGEVIFTHKMDIPWQYFDEEEIRVLNKKADKDPQAVFSALHERYFYEVFTNVRVDFLDIGKFLITQTLHREVKDNLDSLGFNPEAALYEIVENNEVKYVKTYSATPQSDQNDGRYFSFSNSKSRNFFFKDNCRYQIGIFPYFDDTLTNDEIEQQQEESFLSNRFQLCLYVGELRP